MRSISWILLLLVPAVAAFADFEEFPFADPPQIFSWEGNGSGAVVMVDVPEIMWKTEADGTERPLLAGAGEEFTAGGPRLPLYGQLVAAPPGMDLVLGQVSIEWEDGGTHTVVHDPGPIPEQAFRDGNSFEPAPFDMKTYLEVSRRSEQTVTLGETDRWRDLRIAQLTIRPLRYNAETGQTEIARRIEIELQYRPAVDDAYNPPGVSEAFLPLYRAFVLGAEDILREEANELDEIDGQRGTYLIICRPTLEAEISDLGEWKTRCGYNVITATTDETGTTTTSIHDYIDDIYENTDPPLEYVVLFGDMDNPYTIPTYTIPGSPFYNPSICTDHKYSYDTAETSLAGVLPRYFVGRLSVDSAEQAGIVIAKTLQYEVTPDDGDLSRFERALVIARYYTDGAPGISQLQTKQWVREKMLADGFAQVSTVYQNGWNDPGPSGIQTAINNGLSWVNYRGYGAYDAWAGPYYYNSDIAALNNNNELPVITSMVCGGGAFDRPQADPCFGEMWIRTGSVGNPKGAVAFTGPSELDTHTRWNNILDGGWYRGLFDLGMETMGQCLLAAKLEMANAYPNLWNPNPGPYGGQNSAWFYFHTYNILGDPSLLLRKRIPEQIVADFPAELPVNSTHIPVTVSTDNGAPVSSARVVITDSSGAFITTAVATETGQADIIFDTPLDEGSYHLTAISPDLIPLLADFTVTAANGADLLGFEMTEDPDAPENNNDGAVNPGEIAIPAASFEVVYDGGIDGVSVNVSLPDGGGVVLVEDEVFGDLANGSQFTLSEPRIQIESSWPYGQPIPVLFTIVGDGFEQSHLVSYSGVEAPLLSLSGETMDADFAPGSTIAMAITLNNDNPGLDAGMVTGQLICNSPYVTVNDQDGFWGNVPAGGSAVSDDGFELEVAEDCYPGRLIPFTLNLVTEDGYETSLEMTLEVVGGDEITTPTGPAGPGYYIFEDIDTGYGFDTDYEYTSLNTVGTNIGISDMGNNQDETVTIDLPFDFAYWGETYNEISVCSNGWFAFGETDDFFFRNRPIPGALSPAAGVAVFWDDLAEGAVFSYYNEEEGWFGIEWYNVRNTTDSGYPTGSTMRFQARLLDPEIHGAPGGLGMIVLMYDDISNTDQYDSYCSVGIISPDGLDGLQYEFNDTPAPTAQGVQDGLQMTIAVGQGGGISLPDLVFTPPIIQLRSQPGGAINASITATNTGSLRLRYDLWAEGIWPSWALGGGNGGGLQVVNTPQPSDNPASGTELDDFGPQDDFGYFFYDSDESFGPVYDWLDIAVPENEVTLIGETSPRVTDAIDLPFDFPFYGIYYDTLWVSESGYLVFVDPQGEAESVNTQLPRSYAPLAGVFPFWDNIGFEDVNAAIYTQAYADSFVVTWSGLHHLLWDTDDGPYTFQVLLTSDGALHFRYSDMNPSFRSCTIGVQNETGETGFQVVYNTAAESYVHSGLSIRVVPPPLWFQLGGGGGDLGPGESQTIVLEGNTEGLPISIQQARLVARISSMNTIKTVPAWLAIYDETSPAIAPNLAELPGESIVPGGQFHPIVLDPYVFDPDNPDRDLSWTVYGDPMISVDVDENRIAHITADPEWAGEATMIFRASDPFMNFSEQEVVFSTTNQNDPPRFEYASPDIYETCTLDTILTFVVSVSDPEDDEVSLAWYYQNELIGTDSTVTLSLGVIGMDTVRVIASDGVLEVVHEWWIEVDENAVSVNDDVLPTSFALDRIYPNPFNSRITVSYTLPRSANVRVRVFNLLGREVSSVDLSNVAPGRHQMSIDGSAWASGLYFFRWEAGGVRQIRKAVLLK